MGVMLSSFSTSYHGCYSSLRNIYEEWKEDQSKDTHQSKHFSADRSDETDV